MQSSPSSPFFNLLVRGVHWGAPTAVRPIMPTFARQYHCFQRGNEKNSYFSEGKRPFPEGETVFLDKCGVVGDLSSGAGIDGRSQRIGQRELRQRPRIHQHVDRFRCDDDLFLAGNAERRAEGERRRAETNRCDGEFEDLIVCFTS